MAAFERKPLREVLGERGYIRGPFGSALVRGELQSEGIPVYEQQHAITGTREFRFFISDQKFTELSRFQVRPNDLIISCSGTIGRISMIHPGDPMGIISQALLILRPHSRDVLPEFLYYFLLTSEGRHSLVKASHGSVQVNIAPRAVVEQIELPVPTLPEQRAIAHILGTLDDKIELNRRMNETLEEIARAIFKSWFVDFDPVRAKMERRQPPEWSANVIHLFPNDLVDSELGRIPEGWELVPLPKMIEVNPPRSLRKGEVAPYLDMANMPTRGHTPNHVVERPFGSGMRFVNGDTLVARITPCLENGKTAYVDFLGKDQVGWGSTEYIVLRPKSPFPEEFAYCLARSEGFREYAIQSMTGSSGRQRVPTESLAHYALPFPSVELGKRFGLLVRPLFERASAAARESRNLTALRDALVPKLFSGEIQLPQPRHTK